MKNFFNVLFVSTILTVATVASSGPIYSSCKSRPSATERAELDKARRDLIRFQARQDELIASRARSHARVHQLETEARNRAARAAYDRDPARLTEMVEARRQVRAFLDATAPHDLGATAPRSGSGVAGSGASV